MTTLRSIVLTLGITAAVAFPLVVHAQPQDQDLRRYYAQNCAGLDLDFVRGHSFGRNQRPQRYILQNEECVRLAFYLGIVDQPYDSSCYPLLLFFCL